MEQRIETLLEKYFEAQTTIAEERELADYFNGDDVAAHLESYRPLFGYFSSEKMQQPQRAIEIETKNVRRYSVKWISIAASVAVALGVGSYAYFQAQPHNLGTYEDPETAFRETQKALAMLSGHVNTGVEGVHYLKEYEDTKNRVFRVN